MSQRRPTEAEIRDARRLLGVGAGAPRAAILEAWREAVRRNHPDAVPEADRTQAEVLCSHINAAKDMLLEFPAGSPPASGVTVNANANVSVNGNGRPATGGRPATPSTAGAYVPTGVAPAASATPARTGMLLTFLVAGTLALLSILAITTRDDSTSQSSRIGTETTSAPAAAMTPQQEMSALLADGRLDPATRDQLTAPATSRTDLDDIVKRISRIDPGTRAQARANVECAPFQPGIADRVACKIDEPEGPLPYPVEFRRDDQGWHLYGYRRGG